MGCCVGRTTDTLKLLIFIGYLLLIKETYAFRSDYDSNEDSFSYTKHPKHENPEEKKPVLYSIHTDNDDGAVSDTKQDDKVSNYDFYKPLNQRNKERIYYVEGDQIIHKEHAEPVDDLQPYLKYENQKKKWLKEPDSNEEFVDQDGYAYEIDGNVKEQPRYGYNDDGSYETTKAKNSGEGSTWSDGGNVYHKDLTNEKYLLNDLNQSNGRSPYKHSTDQYELKTAYPKVYKSTYEYPTDVKHSNPKALSSFGDLKPLNNYNSKSEYKNGLQKDVNKYEGINNKEWLKTPKEHKHPKSEYHHEIPTKQEYIAKDNYYSKPESINEYKKEYIHGYLHPSKEEKSSAVTGLGHGIIAKEDDFGKHLKSDYLKIHPFSTPKFNHGGHFYGWSYKPYEYLHQKYQADLERKKKVLQDHEKKLIELQRKHMESFKKFMDKEMHGSKHNYPDFRIPAMDDVSNKPNFQIDSQEFQNNHPLKHNAAPNTHHYSLH